MRARGALCFEQFELEQGSDRLRRNGDPIELQPQPARLLRHLMEHSGAVVPREELQCLLWGEADDPRLDQRLHFCIAQIRQALGDSAEQPVYIETVPRRGYRFLQPVRSRQRWQERLLPVAAAGLLIVAAVTGAVWWRLGTAPPPVVEVVEWELEGVGSRAGSRLKGALRDALVLGSVHGRFRVAAPEPSAGGVPKADFEVEGRLARLPDGIGTTFRLRRTADGLYLWAGRYVWSDEDSDEPPAWIDEVVARLEEHVLSPRE